MHCTGRSLELGVLSEDGLYKERARHRRGAGPSALSRVRPRQASGLSGSLVLSRELPSLGESSFSGAANAGITGILRRCCWPYLKVTVVALPGTADILRSCWTCSARAMIPGHPSLIPAFPRDLSCRGLFRLEALVDAVCDAPLRPGKKGAEDCTGTKRTCVAATEVLLDVVPKTFLVAVALDLRRNATKATSRRTTATAVEEASRVLFGGSTSSGFVCLGQGPAPRETIAAFCLIGSPMACN
mmetsp:Transcript_159816/g.512841  ORF Transcript_159816/g.512841 Transcript_159816/m.512841 type:complete len:243 (-) Transcript_159816:198-926(-)